jgi:hypothetical protein
MVCYIDLMNVIIEVLKERKVYNFYELFIESCADYLFELKLYEDMNELLTTNGLSPRGVAS